MVFGSDLASSLAKLPISIPFCFMNSAMSNFAASFRSVSSSTLSTTLEFYTIFSAPSTSRTVASVLVISSSFSVSCSIVPRALVTISSTYLSRAFSKASSSLKSSSSSKSVEVSKSICSSSVELVVWLKLDVLSSLLLSSVGSVKGADPSSITCY